jgi:hypothetical protein
VAAKYRVRTATGERLTMVAGALSGIQRARWTGMTQEPADVETVMAPRSA